MLLGLGLCSMHRAMRSIESDSPMHAAQAEAQRCLQGWSAARLLVAQRQDSETVAAGLNAAAAGVAAAARAAC